MVKRVTVALIAGLCALFAGCGEQEQSQQDAALPDSVVQKPAVPDPGTVTSVGTQPDVTPSVRTANTESIGVILSHLYPPYPQSASGERLATRIWAG